MKSFFGFFSGLKRRRDTLASQIIYNACFSFLIIMSTYIYPSFFTNFITLFAIVEYCRLSSNLEMLFLFLNITITNYVSSYLSSIFDTLISPSKYILPLLRSSMFYFALTIDRLTTKRFGTASYFTLFSFPLIFSGCYEVLSVIDPLGISTHFSAFISQIPDLTIIPLRFFGYAGPTLLLSFLVSFCLLLKHTHTIPKFLSNFLFNLLTIIVIIFSFTQYIVHPSVTHIRGTVIFNATSFLMKESYHYNSTDIIIIAETIPTNETSLIEQISHDTNSIIAFSYMDNITNYISVVSPNKTLFKASSKHSKPIIPFRFGLKKILSVETLFGKIGFINGREMFSPDHFTSEDLDLLITFGSDESDEKCGLPLKTASMISEMIDASRFHISIFSETFIVGSDGVFNIRELHKKEELEKSYDIKVTKNLMKFSGIRFLLVGYVLSFALICSVMMNFIPKINAFDFWPNFIGNLKKYKVL